MKTKDNQPIKKVIINGHPAAVVSELGEHTPGVNSDAYFVNEEGGKDKSILLALVADGVTGGFKDQEELTGKFVAEAVTTIFPQKFQKIKQADPEAHLKLALDETLNELKTAFQEQYKKVVGTISGATTLTGAIESKKELILFGMGDSRAFVLTEVGILEDSLTESHAVGSMVTSYLGAGNEGGEFKPYYPEEISIKHVSKENLLSPAHLILISDGMVPAKHEEELESFVNTLKEHLDKSEDVIQAGLDFAHERESEGLILPDDKTMVVIQLR